MHRRAFRKMLALGLGVIAALVSPSVGAVEPRNLSFVKRDLQIYVDSGEYQQDIVRVAAEAEAWLHQRASPRGDAGQAGPAAPKAEKLAAIFDIDETLLSNLPHMRKMDFGYQPGPWNAWVRAGGAPAIPSVCALFRTARQLGIAVFILSGRSEMDRPGTEKNLRAAGVGDYAGLYFKPDDSAQSTAAFKTAWRKKITAEGYTIVLNIGDQDSDLAGGFAERTFKLPDPFYLLD